MDQTTSDLLTRTGPGTAMGHLMRRYWVPILASSEIAEPDGPQVRVQILGEKLLAFRDTEGQAGLIDEFCAHRGVSLFFGRNEECGIRCAYHGLKYDRTGACVDVPSAPQVADRMSLRRIPALSAVAWCGPTWARLRNSPRRQRWSGARCPRATCTYPNACRKATTCRRLKAASTPHTCLTYTGTR